MIATRTLIRASALAGFALLALTGCLSSGGGRLEVYSPVVTVQAAPDWPSAHWSLLVARPIASETLDSNYVAVRPVSGVMQTYANAQWTDAAPDLMQAALVQGLEDSGKFDSVGRQGSGLHGDFTLLLELRHFESVYADPAQLPSVQLDLQAKLVASASGRVVASRTFQAVAPARGKDVPQVVAAFQSAMSDTVTQVVGWTLANGQANAPKPAK